MYASILFLLRILRLHFSFRQRKLDLSLILNLARDVKSRRQIRIVRKSPSGKSLAFLQNGLVPSVHTSVRMLHQISYVVFVKSNGAYVHRHAVIALSVPTFETLWNLQMFLTLCQKFLFSSYSDNKQLFNVKSNISLRGDRKCQILRRRIINFVQIYACVFFLHFSVLRATV